ncbi:MAG: hypothetical protein NTX13_17515 [Acidobacteria bacterium]|jgi:hypothetical protein|nr:hypothetical protein [Acidobacteriota bacterium]
MHSRRFLSFLLGFWLAGLVGITLFIAFRPRLANGMVGNPPDEAAKWVDLLGKDRTQTLLQHYDAEVGRQMLTFWYYPDLLLCTLILLTAVMIKTGRPTLLGSALLLLLGLASVFLITPQVVAVGRHLDFQPVLPVPPERAQFAAVNRIFHGLGFLRFLIATAMLTMLFNRTQTHRSRRSSYLDEIDAVNNSNHNHINR